MQMPNRWSCENILNTANHQGNANQNHNKMSPLTCQNGYHQKDYKQQILVRMWTLLLVGMPTGAVTVKNSMEVFQKKKKTKRRITI